MKFGPSGNSDSFYEQRHKSSVEMPEWLHHMGLTAYEYSCTRGVNIKEKTARDIGEQALKWGITMSVHAPYYINLASQEKEIQEKSIKYLVNTMKAAEWFGATRVVFHPGSCGSMDRRQAMENTVGVFKRVLEECNPYLERGVHLCPETMGKQNLLGNLNEVLALCLLDDRLVPTIDFGHLHAVGQGAINSKTDYEGILDTISQQLGWDRAAAMHVHFSRIEYTAAGEKKHWTYKDTEYGPDFDPLAELLVERKLYPTIISESRGTMAEDACILKEIYQEKFSLFN